MLYDALSAIVGKTLTSIEIGKQEECVIFNAADGSVFKMFHEQDCCESVWLEDVVGDFADLIGTPIVKAETRESDIGQEDLAKLENSLDECSSYVFYEFATIRGSVTLRWVGSSNGYYSTAVDFVMISG